VLGPLSGSRVTLVPFEATNSLIASGPERAIARLTSLADELDRVEEQTLRMRVLRYRDVTEIESFVEGFLESEGVGARGTQVWSDERTNSIVVRGDGESVERVLRFVDEIDRPIDGDGSIRILRVLNRDPEDVAELIRTFAEPVNSARSEGVASATVLSGADFSISVDKRSRSLVIRADPEVHIAIRELLELLDEQPELIAIDITISELRSPKNFALAFGFQIPFSTGNDSSDLFGVLSNPVDLAGVQTLPTLFGRIQRDSGVSFQETDGNGNLVSVPILQTADIVATDFKGTNEVLIQPSLIVAAGEQHEIFVGDVVPIAVSDASGVGDSSSDSLLSPTLARTTTFERTDIGTRLGIDVRAGREGKIQLNLEIELSRFDPTRAFIAGDPSQVGVAYVTQHLTVTARLEDGESAVLAMDRTEVQTRVNSGVPFLRDLPFIGWLFSSEGTLIQDNRLVIAARARRVSNPAQLVADTIRRRLAFERRSAREVSMPVADGYPYAVRVTTRLREDDAEAIADSLSLRGYVSETHPWSVSGKDYFDVYVIELGSMAEAADVAESLWREGWQTDLVVLSTRS
jgi:general secretion pathway protein D